MNKFFNSCRRCLNPWTMALIIGVIGLLIYFIPVIGVAGLLVLLPLLGCTIMCGAMIFFMGKGHKDKE